MAVSTLTARNAYTAAGGTTFAYQFPIDVAGDLAVYDNDVLVTNYTVTGAGTPNGGNVVFGTAPISGHSIVIVRDQDLLQSLDPSIQAFGLSAIASALDRQMKAVQMLQERVNRALKFAPSSPLVDVVMPTMTGQGGKFLRVNAGETGVETVTGALAAIPDFLASGAGAVARSVTAKLSDWVSVKDFGAVGDDSTDNTAAIMAAIDAALALNAGKGATVLFPPGVYRCDTLSIIDNVANNSRRGLRLLGSNGGASGASLGCVLKFAGAGGASVDFIKLHTRDSSIENLVISAVAGKTLRSLVDIDQESGQANVCTNNGLYGNRITGGGATVQYGVRIGATAAANGEYMRLVRNYLDSFTGSNNACIYIADTVGQSKANRFTQNSYNTATYGILQNKGSFLSDGDTFGALATAILLTNQSEGITIIGADEESCARFLDTRGTGGSGGANTPWPVTIIGGGGRLALNSLHADGIFIHYTFGGPLNLLGVYFALGVAYSATFKIRAHSAAPGSVLNAQGCVFPTDTPFITDGTTAYRLMALANKGINSGASFVTLEDQITRYNADATGTITFNELGLRGDNGQLLQLKRLTELVTIAAAATTDTTIQMPAGAIVLAVPVRVTVVIPTAATFTVGDSGSAARFNTGANVSTAATTTNKGTKAGAYYNASALSVRLTPDLTPADTSGRVRLDIIYLEATAPTT